MGNPWHILKYLMKHPFIQILDFSILIFLNGSVKDSYFLNHFSSAVWIGWIFMGNNNYILKRKF